MTRKQIVCVALLLCACTAVVVLLLHRKHTSATATAEYAPPGACAQCHAQEAAGYARTGMAHAFANASDANTIALHANAGTFHHEASDTYFSLTQHDGKAFQRRWQKGFDGKDDNVEELSIDYVMGSGNHARTFLHRQQNGELIELPMAWYSELGGHFGMNPGFDSAHPMTRRAIAYECMFCHNGYPQTPTVAHRDLSAEPTYGGELPQGIDCQRCHGPGAAHIKAAQTANTPLQQIRAAILNPIRLSNARKMELCEQCHLETTSRLLPDRVRHTDREPFNYKATEPLEQFISYYEPDAPKENAERVQIVNAPYRLRQSQCYLKSQGALTCITCHNPHDLHKGPQSTQYYTNICLRCHAQTIQKEIAAKKHTDAKDCVSCHMPATRTQDVVHVVMTDHLIQRRPAPENLRLIARQEIPDTGSASYHGNVKRYLLDGEKPQADDDLYNALAQVIDSSNLQAGVPALRAAITQHPQTSPTANIELGDALRHTNDLQGAVAAYRDALKIDPLSSRAQRRLGAALGEAGNSSEGIATLNTAIDHEPGNSLLWYEKAQIEQKTGDMSGAIASLRKAVELRPDFADALNNFGALLARTGDSTGAEQQLRAALVVDPYSAGAHANLGRVLAGKGALDEAAFQFDRASSLDPNEVTTRLDDAIVLLQLKRIADAEKQARTAVAADEKSARAHDVLGQVLSQRHASAEARREFEAALHVDANYSPAQLDLAIELLNGGQQVSAMPLLQKAAVSSTPAVAQQARSILQQIGSR